ncbi:MAG TPA: hypothetical protein V6D47_16900 [Oscillatoriaceae cyanobacterium]
MRHRLAALAIALAASPALAKGHLPAPHAAPHAAPPAVVRMASFLAYEPGWMPNDRLAFFGNTTADDPVQLYVWAPGPNHLARATVQAAVRHSLAVWNETFAYVQPGPDSNESTPDPAPSDQNLPAPGSDYLVVQQLHETAGRALFQGQIKPESLHISPDGKRIAFIAQALDQTMHLALVDVTGGPTHLVDLHLPYAVQSIVGWNSNRSVIVSTVDTEGDPTERLLMVGATGVIPLPDGKEPAISPDGKWLLVKAGAAGVYMRTLYGAGRLLDPTATAYAWAPDGKHVFLAQNRDIEEIDLIGHVLHRWKNVASLSAGQLEVSPDGRYLAFGADFGLSVLRLR